MALLLVSCVRTLTCRTIALSRALKASSVQSLHTTVCSHRVFPHAAKSRCFHFRSASCSTLLVQEPVNSMRQSCRCVTSRCSNKNVSITFEEETSENCVSLEQDTVIETSGENERIGVSSGHLEVGQGLRTEIIDRDSEEGLSAEYTLPEEGANVFASEEQTRSTIGVSSDVRQQQGEKETQSAQSSVRDDKADCGMTFVTDCPGDLCGDRGNSEQTDNIPAYSGDGTPQCIDSAPVYFDKQQAAHTDNMTITHIPSLPTVPNDAAPVPAAAMDNIRHHLENTTTTSSTTPQPTTTTASTTPAAPSALPPPSSYTLAPYLPHSQVLQGLVALGVDLSVVEKVPQAADYLLRAEWARDIQPRLLFLRDMGVGVEAGGDSPSPQSHSQSQSRQLGQVLNKNPLILKEEVEEMKERVSYLESKKFSPEQITRIVTFAPLTLLLPVHYVDKKLGFLQNAFHLTGDEVRLVATKLPKIIPWKLQKLKDIRFYMKDMLGFSDKEMKNMLLASPRVYLSDRHQLGKRFDLLHNIMGLSHQHLAAWPSIFRTRLHIIEQRHRFLVLRGRAQYDPNTENYVSLQALVSGTDRDFCERVARASVDQFYSFLRSL